MNASAGRVRPITVAILAMGGEGGGVLADWIVDLAEHGGYLAQATSVPGVAQRTGATIYYVELFPQSAARAAGRAPVLALMPFPGDVDVVLASEFMEAGRAVQRGFVTPDRTTLIASTHRVYAMTERIALADGRVDTRALDEACRAAAKRFIGFDMASLAEASGSLVSAVLFGALAGAGVLPFPRGAFEAAIRRGGVGVAASVAAFTAGFAAVVDGVPTPAPEPPAPETGIDDPGLRARLAELPGAVREVAAAGVARLVDYQDAAYARAYLDRLQAIVGLGDARLADEVARQLALGMAYEDTIRVAELKIRPARFARVRDEVGLAEGQVLEIAEFMHPRTEEIADTLPAPLGRWLVRTRWARRLADRLTRRGRTVATTSIGGFVLLRLVAALKPLRRRSLRFRREDVSLASWLDALARIAAQDRALALEVASARGLVKGYGDTHAHGAAKFDILMQLATRLLGRADAAEILAGLRREALADEEGTRLGEALRRLEAELPGHGRVPARGPVPEAIH
ncbi:MAG: indolepyruvate oxidoreductase [Alphaproteobacteria bacterium]|nr:MAG: indolepyruvate oxidoreductase [Alphaproteobacteria bacterium]